MNEAVLGVKLPARKGVKKVCLADMAQTFKLLHFVSCRTVTVSPNQIIIIIIIAKGSHTGDAKLRFNKDGIYNI